MKKMYQLFLVAFVLGIGSGSARADYCNEVAKYCWDACGSAPLSCYRGCMQSRGCRAENEPEAGKYFCQGVCEVRYFDVVNRYPTTTPIYETRVEALNHLLRSCEKPAVSGPNMTFTLISQSCTGSEE